MNHYNTQSNSTKEIQFLNLWVPQAYPKHFIIISRVTQLGVSQLQKC